ncbi:DUF2851 family protein [Chitinophaga filiformis]|uniref:DUF2851 domain-containing protein n=1 Tax=Chitinophaga filiformis TaxID=104663 RepID=A0A1G7QJM9_CHIFI|nr:DUF2851 family protein [Chitinophaga filiformis]SDF98704.1 Protein of unknown function [Chitinophaga filiformis]
MTIVNVDPLLAEELFQHIWQFRLFTQSALTTLEGEPLHIEHPGQHNRHAGPDFTAARIRIGETLWVGNVELHLKTSDWFRHGHQHDLQYRNVILHVVFEHDMKGGTTNGIPILELQPAVPKLLLQRYESLRQSAAFVPCAAQVTDVPSLIWTCWKDRLLVERLEQKADTFKGWLLQTQYDWEEVCFRAIARAAGMPVNGEAFLHLAQSLPYRLLARQQHDLTYLEALLFGQAGMLDDTATDPYIRGLQREYHYLQHKYHFTPLAAGHWKWLRMRPASFPSMKIAFLAALLHKVPHLFSRMLDAPDAACLEKLLQVRPSDYWQTHYKFGKPVSRTQMPGTRAIHNILINTLLPLLYLYGREKGDTRYQEKAIAFLRQLRAEENHVMTGWNALNIKADSAGQSQALLQLKQYYCDEKHCLKCAVGARLLRSDIA